MVDISNKRYIGLDLFRIMAMISVTSIHFICYSSINKEFGGMPLYNQIFISILRVFDSCFINMFVLLSGFFLCQKVNFKRRIVSIWLETIFVTWSIGCLFLVLFPQSGSIPNIIRTIFPVLSGANWYVLSYLLLLLACPFYNKLIASFDKIQFRNILLFVGIIATIVLTANPIPSSETFIGPATSLLWFSYMYFVGAYLKIYDNNDFGWKKKAGLLVITFVMFWWLLSFGPKLPLRSSLCSGTGIFPLLFSVELFMLMKNIVINRKCRILTVMSSSAFFVYLIQINPMINSVLWNFADVDRVMNTRYLVLDWMAVQVSLWVSAVAMYHLYEWSEKTFLHTVEEWINNKISVQ